MNSGAYVIEKTILEDIYSSYGLTSGLEFEREESNLTFVNQMKMLQ